MQLFLKILCGMANSVDPDQTAPSGAVWSGSALFAYAILSETWVFGILGHLLYVREDCVRGILFNLVPLFVCYILVSVLEGVWVCVWGEWGVGGGCVYLVSTAEWHYCFIGSIWSDRSEQIVDTAPDKRNIQINIWLISSWKQKLWVLVRSTSPRHF